MRRLVFLVALAGCATPPEHESFRQVMQRQVGKHPDDPDFYPAYYKAKQTESKRLPNGNTEDEYRLGRKADCRVFFERDAGSGRVVRWRFQGFERDCVIVPVTTER